MKVFVLDTNVLYAVFAGEPQHNGPEGKKFLLNKLQSFFRGPTAISGPDSFLFISGSITSEFLISRKNNIEEARNYVNILGSIRAIFSKSPTFPVDFDAIDQMIKMDDKSLYKYINNHLLLKKEKMEALYLSQYCITSFYLVVASIVAYANKLGLQDQKRIEAANKLTEIFKADGDLVYNHCLTYVEAYYAPNGSKNDKLFFTDPLEWTFRLFFSKYHNFDLSMDTFINVFWNQVSKDGVVSTVRNNIDINGYESSWESTVKNVWLGKKYSEMSANYFHHIFLMFLTTGRKITKNDFFDGLFFNCPMGGDNLDVYFVTFDKTPLNFLKNESQASYKFIMDTFFG
jgi:hypothetical protein